MCGIFGYTGAFPAAPFVKQGLIDLTYRGYDSAGIAAQNGRTVTVKKGVGSITAVKGIEELLGTCAIGHTRWATHGAVCEKNAHPFTVGEFTVVHNGIIENFRPLKHILTEEGFTFSSDTDSEIIAALLCKYRSQGLIGALQAACKHLVGSFAVAAISSKEPTLIACARQASPLLIGQGKDGFFLSSDANAIAPHTRSVVSLSDGDFALVSPQSARFFRGKEEINPHFISLSAPAEQAETQGCSHFMRKEIAQVPLAVTETVRAFTAQEQSAILAAFQGAKRAVFFGCGTAYHAAVYGKYLFERLCNLPAEAELSSELRYRNPAVTEHTVYIAVSQSGETADTLATVEMLKSRGATVFAVTNTKESSLSRQVNHTFVTQAGVEIGVAATKSFTVQLTAFLLFACALSGKNLPLDTLGDLCRRAAETEGEIAALAAKLSRAKGVFFLGRDLDYALSMEGSLKLKEISYLFSEGYAAGELKHGTLALVEKGVFVIALSTQGFLAKKTMNAVHEVSCRGAETAILTPFGDLLEESGADKVFLLPSAPPEMMPIVASVPLQLIAYHTALCRGYNPDRPRNLAKSVTVE